MEVVGPTPHHRDVIQSELVHHLLEEGGPAQQGLDQGHAYVRTRDSDDDPRESGSGADVAHRRTVRDGLCENRRVEQVTLPQTWCLARADQSAYDAFGGEKLRIALSDRQSLGREHPLRLGRGRGWSRYSPDGPARPIGFT
ncbi:hypothetical protein GCM10027078_03100 [Nocardioides flavus (ex Wang et al. 2016)]